jgi:Mitochondrial carrier protein
MDSPTSSSSSPSASDVTRRMICGGLAGMIAKTATNPLDRIRMLAQTGHGSTKNGTQHAHRGVLELYRAILRDEGILGLWAGNGANLLRVFPSKAIVFSSNDVYKSLLLQNIFWLENGDDGIVNHNMAPPWVSFIAGGMSGMTATLATYPLDLARGRIAGTMKMANQSQKEYAGILRTVSLTVRDEGLLALWRGALPTLIGAMPYEGIKFGTVGVLETYFLPKYQGDGDDSKTIIRATPLQKMCMGGVGGMMAGLITYPNDTVRRLLQLQGSRATDVVYSGYWDCVRQTYQREGITRFFRGFGINIVRMAPNTAVQFGSYELLKQGTAGWI